MMNTGQLVHPDLSLPVRRIRILIASTGCLENPTLAESAYAIRHQLMSAASNLWFTLLMVHGLTSPRPTLRIR
jgi:hypothetical protein